MKDNNMDDALAILMSEYKKHLPDKMAELDKLYQLVINQYSAQHLSDLKIKIHSMHGSAAIYGFLQLSEVAGEMEQVLGNINAALNQEETKVLADLLDQAKKATESSAQKSQFFAPTPSTRQKSEQEKNIYLLLNQDEESQKYLKEIKLFGYNAQVFNTLYSFTKAISDQAPNALVIDMDFVQDFTQEERTELIEKYAKDLPIVFLSRSGAFRFRLKAAQLNGQAFLTKPFLFSDLANALNRMFTAKESQYKVLIIDDDVEVTNYYATILNKVGMQTAVIHEAKEIEKYLHEFSPDLIITDFHMPECNGMELATIIRQQKNFDSIPIIFLSSEENKLKQIKAMASGADDFITKQTNPEYLILSIRNKAARYQKLRELMTKDNLTGLLSKTDILNKLESELKEAKRLSRKVAMSLLTIDNFEKINNHFGHAAGDQVMSSLSLIIHNKLLPNATAGRYSESEVLIILPDTDNEHAYEFTEGLRTQFSGVSYWYDTRMFTATFTAAVATTSTADHAKDLLLHAKSAIDQSMQNTVVKLD